MQTKLSVLFWCFCICFALLAGAGPAKADSVLGVVLKEHRDALTLGSSAPSAVFNSHRDFDPRTGFNGPRSIEIDFESPVFPNAEPVPIPGPLVLLASGLAGFLGLRWRRRKR